MVGGDGTKVGVGRQGEIVVDGEGEIEVWWEKGCVEGSGGGRNMSTKGFLQLPVVWVSRADRLHPDLFQTVESKHELRAWPAEVLPGPWRVST